MQRRSGALRGLLTAAVLALASEGSAEADVTLHHDHGEGTAAQVAPEIEDLLASHSALHRAAVAHAQHKKAEESLANGRPINLPVIPKSPPVCSAPVPFFCSSCQLCHPVPCQQQTINGKLVCAVSVSLMLTVVRRVTAGHAVLQISDVSCLPAVGRAHVRRTRL